jgi:hypothetical protein
MIALSALRLFISVNGSLFNLRNQLLIVATFCSPGRHGLLFIVKMLLSVFHV